MTTIQELEGLFDDHPSLNASLADFEPGSSELAPSPRFHNQAFSPQAGIGLYPSHHSGFRSDSNTSDLESDPEDRDARSLSGGGYSPPAWRRAKNGTRSSGFWDRGDMVMGRSRRDSRESSPEYESADDGEGDRDATLAQAARTRLPTGSLSPEKGRSPSPDPYPTGGGDFGRTFGEGTDINANQDQFQTATRSPEPEGGNNFIRFAMRAEVQHRTEPFEAFFSFLNAKISLITRSWLSLLTSFLAVVLSITLFRMLFAPSTPLPVPDLVKVAGLAKAFEPLIYYSENGISQIGDLQATGVAVWDLGESVRSTNMTSAPIIVRELDELSESLKTLSIELTRFFADVDGDVDGILIVLDWAHRELSALTTLPSTPLLDKVSLLLTTLFPNFLPSPISSPHSPQSYLALFLPPSAALRTRLTLQRTFAEFLSVLEDAITTELATSLKIFALFEAVDRQFLNLARTVIRESDQQDRLESELLSSLWTRVLGSNSEGLRKYEKNKQLLSNVRERTIRGKGVLVEHNGKLMSLKANLEMLRRKLVGPLVRSNESSLSLESQLLGLQGVEVHLRGVREVQKSRVMGMLYGNNDRRRVSWGRDDANSEIDGGRDW